MAPAQSSQDELAPEAGSSAAPVPTKRGPGRPRKNPAGTNATTAGGASGEETPKRKRGRPPRPRTEEELAAIAAKAAMPKRPRGRPRKVRPEDGQQPPQPQPNIVGSTAPPVTSVPSTDVAGTSGAPHAA